MSTGTLIKLGTLVNGGKLWVGYTFIKNGLIEKVALRVTIEETDVSIERVSAKILILND
jgi:hypothetical protein